MVNQRIQCCFYASLLQRCSYANTEQIDRMENVGRLYMHTVLNRLHWFRANSPIHRQSRLSRVLGNARVLFGIRLAYLVAGKGT